MLNTKARLRMDFRSEYKGVTRDGLTLSLVCRNTNDPTHATNGRATHLNARGFKAVSCFCRRNARPQMLS